jgi:ATP/maltotriose-dependent transcriptional regulator MalT
VVSTEEALAGPAAEDVRNRGLLYFNLGRAQAHLGATGAAREAFEQAHTCNLQVQTWYIVLAGAAYLGYLVAQQEGLTAGRERLQSAMDFAAERSLTELPACGFLHYELGRILFLQDDLEGSSAEFEKARARGQAGCVHDVLSNVLVGLARLHGARQHFDLAHEMLHELDVLGQSANPLLFDTSYDVERARLALAERDETHIDAWTRAQGARLGEPFTAERESANLLLLHVLLQRGSFDEAAPIAEWLSEESERRGRRLTYLQAEIGKALVLSGTGSRDGAADRMADVLRKAAGQHLVRPFLDHGEPLRKLLEWMLGRPLSDTAEEHARRIIGRKDPSPAARLPMFRQPLAEPLTEREQEVLFHLSRRLSYQTIADTLFVSHDTVKTHVKRIYNKLDASSRDEALKQARLAGLVLADADTSTATRSDG